MHCTEETLCTKKLSLRFHAAWRASCKRVSTRRRGRCRVGPGQHGQPGAVAQAGDGADQDLHEDRQRLERMRAALALAQSFPAGAAGARQSEAAAEPVPALGRPHIRRALYPPRPPSITLA